MGYGRPAANKRPSYDIVENGLGQLPAAADLYCDIACNPPATWRAYLPGLIVAGSAAAAAGFLGIRYNAPITLFALLIGFALNFLRGDDRLGAGLGFASRSLLRWAVVLLGSCVTLAAFAGLGARSFCILLVIMAATMGTAVIVSRIMKLPLGFGLLAGGAVAICGASAALALFTVIGERRAGKAALSIVLLGISGASATAMLLYPTILHLARLTDAQAGFVLGASIHDVAQAIAGGFAFSPPAGEIATVVKLVRVAMLAPIVAIVAFVLSRNGSGGRGVAPPPWYLVGFFVVCGINSLGWISTTIGRATSDVSSAFLAIAIAAAAIQAPLQELRHCGRQSVVVIGSASVFAFLASVGACLTLL